MKKKERERMMRRKRVVCCSAVWQLEHLMCDDRGWEYGAGMKGGKFERFMTRKTVSFGVTKLVRYCWGKWEVVRSEYIVESLREREVGRRRAECYLYTAEKECEMKTFQEVLRRVMKEWRKQLTPWRSQEVAVKRDSHSSSSQKLENRERVRGERMIIRIGNNSSFHWEPISPIMAF